MDRIEPECDGDCLGRGASVTAHHDQPGDTGGAQGTQRARRLRADAVRQQQGAGDAAVECHPRDRRGCRRHARGGAFGRGRNAGRLQETGTPEQYTRVTDHAGKAATWDLVDIAWHCERQAQAAAAATMAPATACCETCASEAARRNTSSAS